MKAKKRSLFLFISFSALILVYFTNCAGDLQMADELSTLCISQDCYKSNESKLALDVDEALFLEEYNYSNVSSGTNAAPTDVVIQAKQNNTSSPSIQMCMVDVGGACNDGGFKDNIIEWELLSSNNSCAVTSTWAEKELLRIYQQADMSQVADNYKLNGKCVDGYFNVKVLYPCHIDNTLVLDTSILNNLFGNIWQGPKTLRLRMLVNNSSGAPYKKTKELTLNIPGQPLSGETCPQ